MLLAVLALAGGPADACAQTATQQREAAVLKARAGQMAEAQAALRAMLASGTDDGLVAMDLTTLLQQDGKAGRGHRRLREGQQTPTRPTMRCSPRPAPTATSAATTRRRGWRATARARFPGESVWPLLLSLVLSDAGRTAEALELLRTPAAQRASPVERLMAEGYAWRRAGNPAAALKAYGEAVRLSRGNQGVRNEAAGVLLDMGAPFGAAAIAGADAADRGATGAAPWCAGAQRSGRPIRRAASTAPMPRSRDSMRCWPRCRPTTRRCAGVCGSTAWWRCAIACA